MNARVFYPVLLAIILSSCDSTVIYDKFLSAGDSEWSWDEPFEFEADISDTISLHNLYIQVRHTVDYPLSNLYLFVHIQGPSGQSLSDTVNITLADQTGKWLGSGVGKFRELRLLYRKNTVFKEPGLYSFTIEQGMRNPSLPVTDVGLRIEKVKP
jgi:gliding motility-associated lipoprotein GldH